MGSPCVTAGSVALVTVIVQGDFGNFALANAEGSSVFLSLGLRLLASRFWLVTVFNYSHGYSLIW